MPSSLFTPTALGEIALANRVVARAPLGGAQVALVAMRRNGEVVAEGTGKAVLGSPLKALTWFVNEASTYCGGVKAGEFVTTGTCIIPMAVAPGDEVTVDYGELGTMSCRIV